MPFFKHRLIETAVPLFFISAVFTAIIEKILYAPTRELMSVLVLLSLILYIILQTRYLIGYWLAYRDKKIYYKTNLTTYGILFLVNIVLVCIQTPTIIKVYTWLFLPFKLFVFMLHVYVIPAALIVHAILIGMIFVAPYIALRIEGKRR